MGKYISLAVSNSVSKAEWVQAYEETLRFLKIFPLAERRKVNITVRQSRQSGVA